MVDIKLFSGTANQPLAEKVAKLLKTPLGKMELVRFPDGECRVRIEEDVKGKTVFLLQSFSKSVDEHLLEFCLMIDSARRLGAKEIIGIVPWLGYSKQDKEFRQGEAVSVEVIAKMISCLGLSKIIVFDLHSQLIKEYFGMPVTELSAQEVLFEALKGECRDLKDIVVVSPDKGGKGRSCLFAEKHGLPIVYLDKTRSLETGKIVYQKGKEDLSGKTAVIFDDIINRGGTVIESAKILKEMGAKNIIVLATHAVLAGEASQDLQASQVNKIILTDTIFVSEDKRFTKLNIISIASVLTKVISP